MKNQLTKKYSEMSLKEKKLNPLNNLRAVEKALKERQKDRILPLIWQMLTGNTCKNGYIIQIGSTNRLLDYDTYKYEVKKNLQPVDFEPSHGYFGYKPTYDVRDSLEIFKSLRLKVINKVLKNEDLPSI